MLRYRGISRIFGGPFLELVALNRHVEILFEIAEYFSGDHDLPSKNGLLREWFDFFYMLLLKKYRCEYVYKNTIAQQLYLERHDQENSVIINEWYSGGSMADVVIINGTSNVYEIKSEFDSFERLDSQMADYRKIYDRIFVVTCPKKVDAAIARTDDWVGVISLEDDGKLITVKDASSNKANVDPGTVFDCMRESEYCAAVKKAFGFTPERNGWIYSNSRKMFCQLDPIKAHDLMVECVGTRKKKKPFLELIESSPSSLKHACLAFSNTQRFANQLRKRLQSPLNEKICP